MGKEAAGAAGESEMDEDQTPRKRRTQFTRAARTLRILERLRAGWAYDEIGREEKITDRRVRQIVAEHVKRREEVEGGTHANVQIDRLGFAMRVAGEALAKGDVKAITPFIKVIDRLDRYQELANEAAPRRRRTPEDALVIREMIRRIRDDPRPPPAAPPAADAEARSPAAAEPAADAEAGSSPAAAAPARAADAAAGPRDFFPFLSSASR